MDPQAGSTRVVPVVLPLLHGSQNRRRRPADSTLAGDRAARGGDSEALRPWRSRMSEAPAAGRPSLGIRQPKDLGTVWAGPSIGQVPAVGSSPRSREYHRAAAGNRYRGTVNGMAPEQTTTRSFACPR